MTLEDIRDEFSPFGWVVYPARFCFLAFRRPTLSSEEVLTGHTLERLAGKLRAETDGQLAALAAGTGGITVEEARRRLAEARADRETA
jgi:hypothetical protein